MFVFFFTVETFGHQWDCDPVMGFIIAEMRKKQNLMQKEKKNNG